MYAKHFDSECQPVKIKDLKPGNFFIRKPDSAKVYTRGAYDRSSKTYECTDWRDMNRWISLRGDAIVYTGFTF